MPYAHSCHNLFSWLFDFFSDFFVFFLTFYPMRTWFFQWFTPLPLFPRYMKGMRKFNLEKFHSTNNLENLWFFLIDIYIYLNLYAIYRHIYTRDFLPVTFMNPNRPIPPIDTHILFSLERDDVMSGDQKVNSSYFYFCKTLLFFRYVYGIVIF